MKYYQPANFELIEIISDKLKSYFENLLDCNSNFARAVYVDELQSVVPELTAQFDKNNLIYDIGRVFVTAANSNLPIHLDGNDVVKKDLALNWPLWNSSQGVMSWYKVINDNQLMASNSYYSTHIPIYQKEDCELVDSLIMTEPTWVKIGVPHDVVNQSDVNRIIISFRFRPEPYHIWDN